jgi:type II secretory ATPase GspE/PulE/Tfp pilus assembly ATPase PilB-like protein
VWIAASKRGIEVHARIDGRKQTIGNPVGDENNLTDSAERIIRAFANEFEIDSMSLQDSIHHSKGDWIVNGERLGLRINMAPTTVEIDGTSKIISTINIRILHPDRTWDLDSLSFTSPNQQIIEHTLSSCLKGGGGLVLLVGPTGSGKSSTLAGMVNFLCGPEGESGIGLITIESPIEYRFPGAQQIEVGPNSCFDFNSALSGAALRQNPDVILIGEINDAKTAEAALKAARSGHLVLSTLHAGSAIESLDRLRQLVPPDAPLDCLKLVVAQRLVPTLREEHVSNPECRVELSAGQLAGMGFSLDRDVFGDTQNFTVFTEPEGEGVDYRSTYKGLTPAHEVLQVTPELLESSDPRDLATASLGYVPLPTDALISAMNGYTTIQAVQRLIGTSEVFVPRRERGPEQGSD